MELRDKRLLEGIEMHHYMSSDQAAEMYFQAIKDPKQRKAKASARLLKLYKNRLVNRARYPGDPYVYFIQGGKYSHKMNHYLAITDVFLQVRDCFPAGSHISYEIEYQQGAVTTDLFIKYSNEFRGEKQNYWFEVELDSSGDIIEKVKRYEMLETEGKLFIVYKHPRTASKLSVERFYIPVECIPIDEVKTRFISSISSRLK